MCGDISIVSIPLPARLGFLSMLVTRAWAKLLPALLPECCGLFGYVIGKHFFSFFLFCTRELAKQNPGGQNGML